MLRSLKNLRRFTVSALPPAGLHDKAFEHGNANDDIGKVLNFLLDDERWIVRYLVVQTSGSLDGRRVLISPISFREVDWATYHFHLALTKDQVKGSPSIDLDQPISRQHERTYNSYYGYPHYWEFSGPWGTGASPSSLAARGRGEAPAQPGDQPSCDIHLRSAKEVRGYHIQGSDGSIGHVADFIADGESWEVRYLVVDASNWWFGKKVLVAPHWASRISWDEKTVYLDLSRQAIKSSPEWSGTAAIHRDYEARLYAHYGRRVYWTGGDRPPDPKRPHRLHA